MGRSPPQPTGIWEYIATRTSTQHTRLGFRMEFRIIRTCQNRSGRWPIQRSIRQQAIVVVTAEVREEQARRLVPIVEARKAVGMERSFGRRTKEDCLLLRASAFSVKAVAFFFPLRICFRRKNCWVKCLLGVARSDVAIFPDKPCLKS